MSIEITEDRREWRQYLISAAITGEVCEEEERGADRNDDERDGAVYAVSSLIVSTTILDNEDTSELLAGVSSAILDGVRAYRRGQKQAQRERWVHAVGTGATDKGFREWLDARD